MESNHINPALIISKVNVRSSENKKEYKRLKESIKQLGMGQAITICADKENDKQFVVIDGHQRLKIAKELKLESIPTNYMETPNGQTEILQHSLNVQRVTMTDLDEITMMVNLTKKSKSKKEISNYYGKSIPQIEELIQLGNIHPQILKQIDWDRVEKDNEHLQRISIYDQSTQMEAYRDCDYDKNDCLGNWEIDRLKTKLVDTVLPKNMTKELFTNEELAEYAKTFKGKMNISLDLFNVSEDLSPDFFFHSFESKYPLINSILIKLTENAIENEFKWSDTYSYKFISKYDTKRIPLTKIVNYKDPAKTLAKFTYWNGDAIEPEFVLIKKDKKTKKVVEVKEKRPKYSGQAKKFFHTILPLVTKALKPITPVGCDQDIPKVFYWLVENTNQDYKIGGWRTNKVEEKTSKDFIHRVTKEWFDYAIGNCTLKQINQLLIKLDMVCIQRMVEDKWLEDSNFKENVLKCMSVANLISLGVDRGKRVDMIAYLKDNYKKNFPFKDIYKSIDGVTHSNTNWYDSMLFQHASYDK